MLNLLVFWKEKEAWSHDDRVHAPLVTCVPRENVWQWRVVGSLGMQLQCKVAHLHFGVLCSSTR